MSGQMEYIVWHVEQHPKHFDFDRNGLGEAMVRTTGESILTAMREEADPKGRPWARLSEAYARWKAKWFPGRPMAVLEGHMRTLAQLVGLYRITAREIDQVYGVDDEARDLASWFQEGDPGRNRPPRRFYAFGEYARERLRMLLDRHFTKIR